MPIISGGGGTGSGSGVITKIYSNAPVDGITVTATSLTAFSTAWQITGVVVQGGQNIRLHASINASFSATHDCLFAFFRGATQVGTTIAGGVLTGASYPIVMTWIDANPGAGTYTYEIRACEFVAGTITVHQTNITTDVVGGTSIFTAEVYTP